MLMFDWTAWLELWGSHKAEAVVDSIGIIGSIRCPVPYSNPSKNLRLLQSAMLHTFLNELILSSPDERKDDDTQLPWPQPRLMRQPLADAMQSLPLPLATQT